MANISSTPYETIEGTEDSHSGVAWAAIFGGALAAAAVVLILTPLGAALGIASSLPWSHHMEAGKAITLVGSVWLIIVQWVSSGLGGYLTGRLRIKWAGAHTHEIFFRDTVHGFLAWALGLVAGLVLIAAMAMHAADVAPPSPPDMPYMASLFRAAPGGTPATPLTEQDLAESRRIVAMAAATGEITDNDRTYLAGLISTRTGASDDEAQARINNAIARESTDMETAKKGATLASFLATLALFVGAFIASAAGALGGIHRDVHYATGRLTHD